MNSQSLRIGIAGLLSFACIVGVIALALFRVAIPELLQVTTLAATFYLFGVTTNGSGIPKKPTDGGTP